jgi:hypothetical protein
MAVVGDSPRQKALKQLSAQFPVANQQVANGVQAARQISLQQQVGQAAPGTSYRAAQQAGAATAAQAGQQAVQQAGAAQNQQVQLGQLGLQEQGRQLRSDAAGQELALGREQMQTGDRLSRLGMAQKAELFDKQLQFKDDEMGRARLNDRQLIDWAATKAKSAEDFANYSQMAEQTAARQQQIMDMAFKKVSQSLEQGYLGGKQKLDQASKLEIQSMLAEAKKAQEERANAAKNKSTMWQAAGTLGGIAAGAILAAPTGGMSIAAGGMLGGSVGGGVGQMAGGLVK